MIDIEKAINVLLTLEYNREFELIDGYRQHPRGVNFWRWLYERNLINAEDLAIKEAEIAKTLQEEQGLQEMTQQEFDALEPVEKIVMVETNDLEEVITNFDILGIAKKYNIGEADIMAAIDSLKAKGYIS